MSLLSAGSSMLYFARAAAFYPMNGDMSTKQLGIKTLSWPEQYACIIAGEAVIYNDLTVEFFTRLHARSTSSATILCS